MGSCYLKTQDYFTHSRIDQHIIEIGSDRYEGSTAFFGKMASVHHLWLDTVDLDRACAYRIQKTAGDYIQRIKFHNADGEEWAFQYKGPEIHTVYLDNFDWDWEPGNPNRMIEEQRVWYALRGIDMNNDNCQDAHLRQMVHLMEYMADDSIVCIDDTYLLDGEYTGKGGTTIPFLITNGYRVLHNKDYGVILGSGKYRESVI